GQKLINTLSKPKKLTFKQMASGRGEEWAGVFEFNENPQLLGEFADYCDQDAATEHAVREALGELDEVERRTWVLDQHINQRGLRIDLEAVRAARWCVEQETARLRRRLVELTDGRVETEGQRDRIIEFCEARGIVIPDLTKDTVKAAVDEHGEDGDKSALEVLTIRRALGKSSTAKLDRMEAVVSPDGRARGLLQYQGAASTGRWAGRLVQPQNMPGGLDAEPEELVALILARDLDALRERFGSVLNAVSGALRHMFVADEGHEYVAGDYSAIEARIVLALAGEWGKVEVMRMGQDVYLDMASNIFGYPCTDKHEHGAERKVGKAAVLGLGFGCGASKFNSQFCPDRDAAFCQGVVDIYRKEWAPEVPKLWRRVEDAAIYAVRTGKPTAVSVRLPDGSTTRVVRYLVEGQWLTCELPSGRKLWYFGPELEHDETPWGTPCFKLYFYADKVVGTGQKKWCRIGAYGGLLVENIVQAVARDIMRDALFRCESRGLPVVLTVHDELVTEPPVGKCSPAELERIMCAVEPWTQRLNIPIAAEAWNGGRYRK
ncbi:MAG: hypothetical protein GVY11_07430, partial [Gammaproteobacteria bacterium]|nr:hypothetical protein [Gammaproteobacteria bacterium]